MKPFLLSLIIASAAAVCGCRDEPQAASKPTAAAAPVPVRVAHPRRGEISRWVSLPGTVRPYQQATLHAKISGYLKNIPVDRGDHIKAGALIAEIESPELVADTAKFKAELEVAQINVRRLSEASQKAPDLVVPFTVDEARSKLEVARAAVARNETLLAFARILAPFDGVITRRFVDPGALIPAATSGGAAQSAAIVTLMDFASVRIEIPVPENEVPLVRTGLAANTVVEELPSRVFTGQVTRFAYALDDATKTMLAEVQLRNEQGELRPGMYVTTRIAVQTRADALLIPADALVTEKAKTSVFKSKDGKASKIPVKVGFQDGASVEVLDGVAPEDALILVGKQTLNDGQAVTETK